MLGHSFPTRRSSDLIDAPAEKNGESIRAQIPGAAVKPPLVEYYLTGLDAKGEAVASRGDASSPLRIGVPEPTKPWVLPVAIGGGVLGAAAIVGGLALAGVFKGSDSQGRGSSTVSVNVSDAGYRFR